MKKILIFLSLSILTISCATAQLPSGKGWKNITTSKANFPDTTNFAKTLMVKKVPLVASATDLNKLAGISTTNTELANIHGLSGPIQSLLDAKQAALVSGSTIKTLNGNSLLGSGDLVISGAGTVTSVAGTNANGVSFSIANNTSAANITITLGDITPSHINGVGISSGGSSPSVTVTGASSLSGSNTGDNAVNSLYSSLESNFTHTGDVTGNHALTITNGAITMTKMANMATGSVIYRKTAGTGAPEVQTLATLKTDLGLTGTNSGDQINITGNAATASALQTGRYINTVLFNGTSDITVPINVAPGAAGGWLGSDGSNWIRKPPPDTVKFVDYAAPKHPTIRALTSSGTLQIGDDGNYITMTNGSATTLTIPLYASVAFLPGTGVTFINLGAGVCTITLTGGVSADYPALGVPQHGWVFLLNTGTNTWAITGKLQ